MPTNGSSTGTGIIILGMHRSGTSLAAEIAYQSGELLRWMRASYFEPNSGNRAGIGDIVPWCS